VRWTLLDSNPGEREEDFTLRQIRLCLERAGHSVLRLCTAVGAYCNTPLRIPDEIEQTLKAFMPQRILWCGLAGLPYFALWSREPWLSIPKIALWFDEPVTRVECIGLGEVMRRTAGRTDFFHGIWDGYWRDDALNRWGIQARAIHLAADENEYHPLLTSHLSPPVHLGAGSLTSHLDVVFIGMLHSAESILKLVKPLPRGLSALTAAIRARVEKDLSPLTSHLSPPIPSWDRLWKEAEAELKPKERNLIGIECEKEPLALCSMRYAAWAMAKNAVRIRILRKALEVAPLLVFCEQKHLGHARETEWRALLGEQGDRLRIVDTTGVKADQLGRLYHEGIIHIQATDPQSVQGGIPYRVFQTAASGRPLLTDLRPELLECFEPGKEILGYSSANDFVPALAAALANRDQLIEIGRAARRRFEREHTWRHRVATIEGWIAVGGLGEAAGATGSPSTAKFS